MTKHKTDCECVTCLLKPGDPCTKSKCIATAGHAGPCVPLTKAPAMFMKLLAMGAMKHLGGDS